MAIVQPMAKIRASKEALHFPFPELLLHYSVRFDDNATFRRYEQFPFAGGANLSDIFLCLTLP